MCATFCISFYCRKSKMNKNGLSPLELSIVINQERILLNLPSRLNPKHFNKKNANLHILKISLMHIVLRLMKFAQR